MSVRRICFLVMTSRNTKGNRRKSNERSLEGRAGSAVSLPLLLGVITIHTVVQIQSYGKLINYVGIVRGATQRLVKLELEGFARDDILEYLDGIFAGVEWGRGEPYGASFPVMHGIRRKI